MKSKIVFVYTSNVSVIVATKSKTSVSLKKKQKFFYEKISSFSVFYLKNNKFICNKFLNEKKNIKNIL